MTPDQLRRNLRSQLEAWFRIDEWSLSNPESRVDDQRPASSAREQPVAHLQAIKNTAGVSRHLTYQLEQSISYSIIYRISNRFTYYEVLEVYRSPFENQMFAFTGHLAAKPECVGCTELRKLNAKVYCSELPQGDYRLIGRLDGVAIYESDPISQSTSPLFTP